ncbi:MAG: CoA transferase [Deltaproteobacteria bacterium]|nr:CoA transferase [Deltaproteobacteria bacterium]
MTTALRPLTGIKVFDFSATVLGPTVTRYLADHGATVVRIESLSHLETTRIATPYGGNQPGINSSGYFATHNAGKLSITVNMKKPKAMQVVERLIRWADVLIESFAPGVMARWGLSYEDVRRIKPEIIMASTSLQGQYGPYASHRGYGQMASAMAGWYEVTGWPDGEPVGPYSAYSDFIDWNFLLVSILTALDYRRRTGEGQYIEQSQLESALQFLAPAILDYEFNGTVAGRMGNRDPYAAPHGAYRCLGEDRWCAIAVNCDEEWWAFCTVLGDLPWSREERFQTLAGRKANEDELDRLVEAWTCERKAEDVTAVMQAAGVPAGVVQNAEDLFGDPQLAHRGHFAVLDHPEIGPYRIATSCFHLSRCPNNPLSPAPLLGEHNELVLEQFLGMTKDEISDLVAEGVLE